jgi:hypothetical protein
MKRIATMLVALLAAAPLHAQISPLAPPQNAPLDNPGTPGRSITEAEARKLLSDHGYPELSDLVRDGEGNWTATAVVNGKPAKVGINRDGQVRSANP